MKKILCISFLFPFLTFSQLNFDGVVKDKATGTELENATVIVKPRRISGSGYYAGVLTLADGAFQVRTSYNYPLEIIVTKKGCARKVIKVIKGEASYDIFIECESETIKQIIEEKSADSDGDGILDLNDKCEDIVGDKENQGCPWPDDDNDGINNNDDECPQEAGIVENKGCPIIDSDSDGIADKDDACPNEIGTAESQGCPTNPDAMNDFFKKEYSTILFSANSPIQDSFYNTALNEISNLLKKYPNISLQISGHASSDGSNAFNQTLSSERASNIKKELVQRGIDISRLKDTGFGEENPIESNETKAGRVKNRRVSLSIQ
tara:strand:- start:1614 stop:2579 length:966 start_codon:yes stop_codon:yes gene_type:complete